MGRRIKEPSSAHRNHIAEAAQALFMEKGIHAATMNDIAKKASYSKATLYVYFKNKEEIINLLVLQSMEGLYHHLCDAIVDHMTTKQSYDAICTALLQYQANFPFYFKLVLQHIHIDFDQPMEESEHRETYLIGERINEKLKEFFEKGIANKEIRADIAILPTIFCFWGMLSGLIQLSSSKEEYIAHTFHLNNREFLTYGFEMLYQSIRQKEEIHA